MGSTSNAIRDMLGVEYPVFCGGMHWFNDPGLCAAVSQAGGVGCLSASRYEDPEALRDAIRDVRSITGNPFSVNITWLPMRFPEGLIERWWRVCMEESVAMVEASGVSPNRFVAPAHEAGLKVIQQVGSARHALHAQQAGVDAVMAVGFEAGGHPLIDNVTTMVLVPRIADSVDIPVIAGGGIADGRGVASAFVLGACGVVMGTRFLFTQESPLNETLKLRFLEIRENETYIAQTPMGMQARLIDVGLGNRIDHQAEGFDDVTRLVSLINGDDIERANDAGDVELAVWSLGQDIGLIEDIPTCHELVERVVADATRILGDGFMGV